VDDLPRTSTGKVLRRELPALFAETAGGEPER
jgi:acyl-coenzyme A synthetase/AMP-(fatty) acid ligase